MIQTITQTQENFAITTVIARDSVELKLATLPAYCDGLMRHSLWLALSTWAFYLNRIFAMLENFCKNLFLRVWISRQITSNILNGPVTHG